MTLILAFLIHTGVNVGIVAMGVITTVRKRTYNGV